MSFFQDNEWKKWIYMIFLEIIVLKKGELCGFSKSYSKKMEIRGDSEKMLKKNGVLAFFHVLIQESEWTFGFLSR